MQLRDVQRLIKPFQGDVASASSPDKQQILQNKSRLSFDDLTFVMVVFITSNRKIGIDISKI